MSRETAFERLFKDCYAQLYSFAMGMVGDEELCKDILGDSFEMLWNHLNEISEEGQKGYVYRTVRNKCIDLARGKMTHQKYEIFYRTVYGDESDEDGSVLLETELKIERICQLLETLTPETQLILERCFFKGERQALVAEELGISVSAVKKHISKALKSIRAKMDVEGIKSQ
jgi:RNA polymerase sigma-70 factor (family 1)